MSDTVSTYVTELRDLLKRRQDDIRERNRQIDDGLFAAMRDPRRPEAAPEKKTVPPALNFAPLENAATRLDESAKRYQRALETGRAKIASDPAALTRLNANLRAAEQRLTDPAGLPHREWYRHLIYAPGFYTGYGVKTVPGVRESIEQDEYAQADGEIVRAASAITRLIDSIDRASSELESK